MQYRVLDQLSGPRGHAECVVEGPVPAGTGLEWSGPVRGCLELEKGGEEYSARGRLEATVVLPCSRCTRPHEVRVGLEVNEAVALRQIDEPDSYREQDSDSPIPVLSGRTVDLSELVRQMLVLHAPVRSLCQPDCQGLCPHCGANLNEDSCTCGAEEIDPRLAPLRELL